MAHRLRKPPRPRRPNPRPRALTDDMISKHEALVARRAVRQREGAMDRIRADMRNKYSRSRSIDMYASEGTKGWAKPMWSKEPWKPRKVELPAALKKKRRKPRPKPKVD